ncbi:MAG: hypothetical protein JXR19_10560 [Bacteroidia bacterium]
MDNCTSGRDRTKVETLKNCQFERVNPTEPKVHNFATFSCIKGVKNSKIKAIPIMVVCMLIISTLSCKKNDHIQQNIELEFKTRFKAPVNNIPLLDSGELVSLKSEVVNVNAHDSLLAYNVIAEDIQIVNVTQVDLWRADGCNLNMNFMKNIKVFIQSTYEPETLIVQRDSVYTNSQGMGFGTSIQDDLSKHLINGTFWLRIEFETDEPTNEIGYINFFPWFRVKAVKVE